MMIKKTITTTSLKSYSKDWGFYFSCLPLFPHKYYHHFLLFPTPLSPLSPPANHLPRRSPAACSYSPILHYYLSTLLSSFYSILWAAFILLLYKLLLLTTLFITFIIFISLSIISNLFTSCSTLFLLFLKTHKTLFEAKKDDHSLRFLSCFNCCCSTVCCYDLSLWVCEMVENI